MGELVVKIVFMGVAPIVFTFLGMRPRPREQWRYWGVGLALLGVVFLGLAFVVPREVRALVTPFLLLSPSALATLGVVSRDLVRRRKPVAWILGPLSYLAVWVVGLVICFRTGWIGG
ncbi:MAG: hypothetical protein U0610_31990 [bacterium]